MKRLCAIIMMTIALLACDKQSNTTNNAQSPTATASPFAGSLKDLKLPEKIGDKEMGEWKLADKKEYSQAPGMDRSIVETKESLGASEAVWVLYQAQHLSDSPFIALKVLNFPSPEDASKALQKLRKSYEDTNATNLKEAEQNKENIIGRLDIKQEPKIKNGQRVGEKLIVDDLLYNIERGSGELIGRHVIWTNGSLLIIPTGIGYGGSAEPFEKAFTLF